MLNASVSAVSRRAIAARRLRDLLRTEILRGQNTDGLMPSETQLAARHGVSRNTVREALALLRQEGLVDRVQGVGTFVVRRKTAHRFDQVRSWEGGGVHHEVLAMDLERAGTVVARALGIELGDPVMLLERRTMLEATPLALWTTYLPESVGGGLRAPHINLGGDYYDLLESALDIRISGVQSTTEAVLSDGDVAEALGVPDNWPLLLVERTVIDENGRAVEFGFGRLRGDRVSLAAWRDRSDGRALRHGRPASG